MKKFIMSVIGYLFIWISVSLNYDWSIRDMEFGAVWMAQLILIVAGVIINKESDKQ